MDPPRHPENAMMESIFLMERLTGIVSGFLPLEGTTWVRGYFVAPAYS